MVNKYDKLGTLWTIAGFLGIIGLALLYQGNAMAIEIIGMLIFTVASFGLALHFTMHDYEKEVRKKGE